MANLAPSAAGGASSTCTPVQDGAPPTEDYYATRVATVILVKRTGEVVFIERDRWMMMGPIPVEQVASVGTNTAPGEKAGTIIEAAASVGAGAGAGSETRTEPIPGGSKDDLGAKCEKQPVLAPSLSGLAQRVYRFRLDI